MKRNFTCLALFTLLPSIIMAQKKQFTLDDLLPGGATYYQNTVPDNKSFTWIGNVESVLIDRKISDVKQDACILTDVNSCALIDKSNGTDNSTLFTLQQINSILNKEGKKLVSSLQYSTFPYNGKANIVQVGRTDGSKYLIDYTDSKLIWSFENLDGKSAIDINYKTLNVVFKRNNNLYVLNNGKSDTIQVTSDGSGDIVYGEAVHRNEFGIDKGTYWSPSGKFLAFYRMDQSMVSTYPQVNIDTEGNKSRCAELVPDKYPMAGEAMHKVKVGIYDVVKDTTIYLKTDDSADRYYTNIVWSPDNQMVYMLELNRDQTNCELVEYSAKTGKKLRVVMKEYNSKYVEPCEPIRFLPWDPYSYIYVSRRNGYNHLYLCDLSTGAIIRQLTKGKFEVIDLLGFNDFSQTVIYTSNEVSPIQKNVYSVDMNGKRQLLGNSTGWHNAKLSPSGEFVCDNYSSPIIPRHIDIVNTETGWTSNIFSAEDKWRQYNVPTIKQGTIKAADGVTDLYYRMILPVDFNPNKKYPAIVYVYGGPHAHNVDASFHYGARGWDIWMAQKGYVMFCLDNRGSEHRGREFEQATFRNLGVEEMKDQMKGVDFLKSLEYVDSARLGVHGWSFGGFMTTSLMTTYPDVFKVGVAGGPVIDWKYYEVMYGERYMDTPQSNPEGYAKTSLIGKAANLKGRLMIIYGGNDPVCVPQHSLSFIRACIDAGTYPDLFTYPGDGHNMFGTDRVHLHNVISRYFDDHLK